MTFGTKGRLLKPRLILFALLTMASGILFGATSIAIWSDCRATLKHAELKAADTTRLLEEHLKRQLGGTIAAIQDLRGELDLRMPLRPERLRNAKPTTAIHIYVFDHQGRRLAGTANDLGDVGPDDHILRSHRSGLDMVVGPALVGQGDHQMFTVSLRLMNRGEFGGMVLATLPTETFSPLYTALDLGSNSLLGLYRFDGRVVARYPYVEGMLHKTIGAWALFWEHLPASPVGTFDAVSPIDHIERQYSYRVLKDTPLIALVGISRSQVLVDWQRRSLFALLTTGLAWMVLCGLTWMAYRHLRGEELARDSLEDEVAARTMDLRIAKDDLKRARDVAEHANRAKSRFLAAASHDLRQPFQAMNLFHTVLMSRLSEPKDRDVAEKLGEALKAGSALLDALLDMSTLEAGIQQVKPQDIELGPMLQALAAETAVQAAAKNVTIKAVPTSLVVHSDQVLLMRALRNMVLNAVRYTEQGRVLVGCRRRGKSVRIEVWDTGIGIPSDKLQVIFEDFYQLGNAERDRSQGLGLGLSIVRRTAALLGLKVDVRSQVGRGSVFALSVPLAKRPKAQRSKARQAISRRQKPSGQSIESTAA